MRVVVTGATGNIGTAVLRALGREAPGADVVATARRVPAGAGPETPSRTQWQARDLRTDDLDDLLAGADAVVHLAWAFHPAHEPEQTWRTNVVGTRRLLEAAGRSGVGHVVAASSVAAYSPRRDLDPIDEDWPTDGTSAAPYAREKAYVERLLDGFEGANPDVVVTRMRPAFVFQQPAASEQRRIFAGPLVPPRLAMRAASVLLPLPAGLALQAVHADDVATAVASAVLRRAGGAFNLAGDGVLGGDELQEVFGGRPVQVPTALARSVVAAGFALRALPADPRLLDALLAVPMLGTDQARDRLGWQPEHTAAEALDALRTGLLDRRGAPTPPLHGSDERPPG